MFVCGEGREEGRCLCVFYQSSFFSTCVREEMDFCFAVINHVALNLKKLFKIT